MSLIQDLIPQLLMERPCFLSILLVFFAMNCLLGTTEATNNITTDQSSLLTFKAHITDDPHKILARNWSAATSVCTWIGIACSDDHNNRVTSLNLTSMGLTGTIPPHIGNLSFLVTLHLENNSFHGSLPKELAYLHRIEFINLGYNRFPGEIPSWFGSFPKLQHLYLQVNNFTGSIPPLLGNISTLKTLHLMENDLEGNIPDEIGNLTNLEMFILYGNPHISGSIPPTIFNISSLNMINCAFTRLSGSLPDDMCLHLPVLQRLILHHNQHVGSIPSSLGKCTQLLRISLDFNKLTGMIPISIGKLNLLEELYLDNNDLEGKIPEELGSLRALQRLRIGSTGLTGPIPRSLSNCTSLWELELHDSSLTGSIPSELGDLSNLMILSLQNNRLTGSIPSSIFNLSKLQNIQLYTNHLSGSLPSSFGLGLPNLEGIYIWENELEGIIPNSISNASKLTILELELNSFSGPIPTTLGNLKNLEWLNLESNQLTREPSSPELSFLTSLTNCKLLTTITLNGNPLNGTLPFSMGNFSTELESFSADDCKIKGSIPKEVGNLSYLTALSLKNNELIGSIPTVVGKMRKLQGLYLEGNRLQGSIPNEICHLRSLSELYLGSNKLFGSIPTCLGSVTSLRHLYLNSNNLTSQIPSTLWSLQDILDINLSENSLSGQLSFDIGNLRAVTQLDLSRNELSGDIPNSIGGLQNLLNLSIAHNRFQGTIPESFGNMISLEFMDLSSNNLLGLIPKSLEKLVYLKYINVSFNRLEGEIPTRGPFANFSAGSFLPNSALCGTFHPQIPRCKISTHQLSKTTRFRILVYIFSGIASIILVLALVFLLFRCQKRNMKSLDEEDVLTLANWRRISYQELQHAADGFDESSLLGRGGFGSVYKGKLLDGMNVAIKVFNLQVERSLKSFDTECEVMCKIRHRNLVKIISSCSNNEFKALILEYMPNGSLEKWLYSHCLDILQRLNIMIDVASALEYLHHGDETPIVHCDLKPSNVLLDDDMVAHVGDFGISKLLGEGDSMIQTNTLATIGYMAPEYGSEGIVSAKGDVYSFGILLMETFTRKKPTENMFEGGMSLKCWVKAALPHSVNEIADASLLGEENFVAKKDCISSTLELAVGCSDDLSERRIDIINVLSTLKNIRTKFQKSVVMT